MLLKIKEFLSYVLHCSHSWWKSKTEVSNPAGLLVLSLSEMLHYRTQLEGIFSLRLRLQSFTCIYEILNLQLQDLLQQYMKTISAGAAALVRDAEFTVQVKYCF